MLTPISYPGGKSKFINKFLYKYFPKKFENYYEPFIGGGSVALYFAKLYPDKKIIINDYDYNLYCLWKTIKNNCDNLIIKLEYEHNEMKNEAGNNIKEFGKNFLIPLLKKKLNEEADEFERAVFYFIANRVAYSGIIISFSELAFIRKFTLSSIKKLKEISNLMKNFEIYNYDYAEIFKMVNENDFVFLDPPYKIDSKLYGINGELHKIFDHQRFYNEVLNLKGKWMITYNYSDEFKELYKDFNLYEEIYNYCFAVGQGRKQTLKKELIITNY